MMKKIILGLLILIVVPLVTAAIDTSNLGNLQVQETKYVPYPAEPGKYLTIWIDVDNQGGSAVSNILFKFDPDYPFKLNPGETGIVKTGVIPAGRDQLLEYTLKVDDAALEGTYNIKLKLCLDESCSSWAKTYDLPISVRTGGAPKIEIGLEETDIFSSGSLGYFTLNIVNRGQLDTKFLTVDIIDSDKYEIIGPSEKYIGELESDDFETAEYQIFIENDIGKKESEVLDVQVKTEYSDENNKQYADFESIKLKVYTARDLKRMHLVSSGSHFSWIILIILIGAGYWWYRRRKRKKRS